MQQNDALAEALEYFAGAIEDGQIDPARIDGAMLRELVKMARGMGPETTLAEIWNRSHDIIARAWRHAPVANE